MIYLFVLFLLLCLSFRYDICGKTKHRDQWYLVILIIFILIAGLRYRLGIDTQRYLFSFYHYYPTIDKFSFADYYIGKDPLYALLNSIVRSMGGRFYMVQLIDAAFVNYLILRYFKKHSEYIFTCAFFFFLMSYVYFLFEIIRANFSIAICLYAFDYMQEKKWKKGYLLLLIATMFHAQTLVLYVIPLLMFLRFNKRGILVLLVALVVGASLQQILGDYMFLLEGNDHLEGKVAGYIENDKYGENNRNINYFILTLSLQVVYPLFSLWYSKRYSKNERLKKLEPFLMQGTAFVMVELSFMIAYRFVDYYMIYFALFFAEAFVCMVKRINKRNSHLKLGFAAYLICLIVFSPLLINIRKYFDVRYYPYSSVITKSVDREREIRYMNGHTYNFPRSDEY